MISKNRKESDRLMKHILCFGDSLTYGYAAQDGGRLAAEARWTSCLAALLGSEYKLIAEGLNGRTVGHYDSIWPERNGVDVFPSYLQRHTPLSLIIILLGTNDILYSGAETVGDDMDTLLAQAAEFAPQAKVLLLTPPLQDTDAQTDRMLRRLATCYRELAQQRGTYFVNCQDWDLPLDIDGCHLCAAGQRSLARHLAEVIKTLELNDSL